MFFECSKKKDTTTPSTPSTPIKSHYSHGFSLSSSSTKPTTFFFETNGIPNETKPFYLFLAQSWPNPKKSIHQVAPDFGASLPFFCLFSTTSVVLVQRCLCPKTGQRGVGVSRISRQLLSPVVLSSRVNENRLCAFCDASAFCLELVSATCV